MFNMRAQVPESGLVAFYPSPEMPTMKAAITIMEW
jgi:hypothetical protein